MEAEAVNYAGPDVVQRSVLSTSIDKLLDGVGSTSRIPVCAPSWMAHPSLTSSRCDRVRSCQYDLNDPVGDLPCQLPCTVFLILDPFPVAGSVLASRLASRLAWRRN
jgi:hypothetical protein